MSEGTSIIKPQNMTELMEFSTALSKSGLVPNDFQGKPNNIMVAIQWGSELGIGAMSSLQNISVINGRPSIWGDTLLALVMKHPDFLGCEEKFEGETAKCIIKRRMSDGSVQTTEGVFTIDMAKQAHLWNKRGPWQQYPNRMLQMRARGFAVRDAFPDAIKGTLTVEEANDTPPPQTQGSPIADKPVEIGKGVTSAKQIAEAVSESNTAIKDGEQLDEGEVVVSPTEQTEDEHRSLDEMGKKVLHIPRCEPEVFDSDDDWSNRYVQLQDQVAQSQAIKPRDKMTKLRELEDANKEELSLLPTDRDDDLHKRRLEYNKQFGAAMKEGEDNGK